MDYYAGIDVSVECSSVCLVDAAGKVIREGKTASEPEALIAWLRWRGLQVARIGLEAGPLSQWLCAGLQASGFVVDLLETRHVKAALAAMPVKTDRNDARGIAQLIRMGWFRSVHCKSLEAQELRALLTARKLLQSKMLDFEMSLRGILRNFGLKVREVTRAKFAARITELVCGQPTLEVLAKALLAARATLLREFNDLDKRVQRIARSDLRTRLLCTAPGVGAIVALTYVATIDDPTRFKSSKQIGPYLGLTPKKYQSGETDISGHITKVGDAGLRAALYEAAHVILTRPLKGGALKSWATRLAKRTGPAKAKVALARKLAVILHRMWMTATPFNPAAAAA